MPEIVINTGPIIAVTAAIGDLGIIDDLYNEVLITREVYLELQAGGKDSIEINSLKKLSNTMILTAELEIPLFLKSELDVGEASVIQSAVDQHIPLVAIDEKHGRRIARLHGLSLTGSLGILVKATKAGLVENLETCFDRMRAYGIWISQDLVNRAIQEVKTQDK